LAGTVPAQEGSPALIATGTLKPGLYLLAFQPAPGLGAGPSTAWIPVLP
jgi:hypothetical protein